MSTPQYRKSTYSTSQGGDCVEAACARNQADGAKRHLLRDSKDPKGPVLSFRTAEWEALLGGIKGGDFDQM